MEKLDLSKKYKSYFSATSNPKLIEIEKAVFLSIVGKGDPSNDDFEENISALYSTVYAIKFACKALKQDFVVSKLEGLWWFDEAAFGQQSITEAPKKIPRSEWHYRLLIRLPDYVTTTMVNAAIHTVVSKKQLTRAQKIERYEMTEGKCVQVLHVGPFETEPLTLKRIHEFTSSEGLIKNGHHHEIYLSDFRKTSPDKLKTILREPVKSNK